MSILHPNSRLGHISKILAFPTMHGFSVLIILLTQQFSDTTVSCTAPPLCNTVCWPLKGTMILKALAKHFRSPKIYLECSWSRLAKRLYILEARNNDVIQDPLSENCNKGLVAKL